MHVRPLVSSLIAVSLALVATPARAQMRDQSNDSYSDGLIAADYLRLSGGGIAPIRPTGSLRDWSGGSTFGLVWEGWQPGPSGVGRVGFGFGVDYSRLPLNQRQFISTFRPQTGGGAGRATSATAASATLFSIGTNLRVRIPAPFVMPSVVFGFGYLDFRPGIIQYTLPGGGPSTASEQHRRGAELRAGIGLDKQVVDRFGFFGEALYEYGLTSLGHGLATPGGTCINNECDALQNTVFGVVRGGLRVRIGR